MQEAIVVRVEASDKKSMLLFDREHGLIRMRSTVRTRGHMHVAQGMLISYSAHVMRNSRVALSIDPIALPVAEIQADIHFLHHVLEMLRMFLSFHQQEEELFYHCLGLFDDALLQQFSYASFRVLFLCRLFALLGVYPDEQLFHQYPAMSRLILCPLMTMVNHSEKIDVQVLLRWIRGCIETHPHVNTLMTATWWRQA